MDYIHMAGDGNDWQVLLNTVINLKGKGNVVPVLAMKACRGSRGIAPLK
jgi:hypothetical protein